MLCYECVQSGDRHEAIGLCHHCSVALCKYHGHVIADPMTTIIPLVREVALPKEARLLLCDTCLAAMKQIREYENAGENPIREKVEVH